MEGSSLSIKLGYENNYVSWKCGRSLDRRDEWKGQYREREEVVYPAIGYNQ